MPGKWSCTRRHAIGVPGSGTAGRPVVSRRSTRQHATASWRPDLRTLALDMRQQSEPFLVASEQSRPRHDVSYCWQSCLRARLCTRHSIMQPPGRRNDGRAIAIIAAVELPDMIGKQCLRSVLSPRTQVETRVFQNVCTSAASPWRLCTPKSQVFRSSTSLGSTGCSTLALDLLCLQSATALGREALRVMSQSSDKIKGIVIHCPVVLLASHRIRRVVTQTFTHDSLALLPYCHHLHPVCIRALS